jgi:hypothetical protein
MFYFIWVPVAIILYAVTGWLSVKVNVSDNRFWYIPFTLLQMFPFWVIVARYSKNLILDSLIYDVTIFLISTISIGFFSGQVLQFSIFQYVGFGLVILGFILMQLR